MGIAIGLTIAVAFLFYKSLLGMITGIVIVPFYLQQYLEEVEQKKNQRLHVEFKEYTMLISNSLQAGYSLERALLQSEEELIKLYGKNGILIGPVHEMNQKIKMNIQVERAFVEFAKRLRLDEAEFLSEILLFAKRSGGDYGKQIKNTSTKIEEKLMIEQEIDTMITEKKVEFKVMCLMPLGILAYIAITSSEFIEPLYKNTLGVSLMTACLFAYGAIVLVGRRIIKIKV